MIKVINNSKEIVISGHANYEEYGKDIVCASVSSIITTSVNAIYSLNNKAISVSDKNDVMIITKVNIDEISQKLLNNMLNMLEELSKDYPKNINVRNEG